MQELHIRDVLLNWAYAECVSPRWNVKYTSLVSQDLLNKILHAQVFDARTLTLEQQDILIEGLKRYRSALIDAYLTHTNIYHIERFSVDEVSNFETMHEMHWQKRKLTLKEFFKQPPNPSFAKDPRAVSIEMCKQNNMLSNGMAIAVQEKHQRVMILIEGYARSLAFLQKDVPGSKLDVIVCR